ncbi:ATP-binding protein of ABC transporter [Crocosphaera subtropica ATCC 51142]|uniref:ATP-binding protein of ABC transporter n=1 Tax=Crocosphaera subtropica (strain ATCC 51142 / BH68) TaxID=43989 RepID=B1WV85_CROS5|nr:ABC transporter ATP-binding protein/permease [Crocosphaera subtropica]ACB52282.1 ATP-binding protein of ABC transporter [Crocosphaera subtropica ATCC 51142]
MAQPRFQFNRQLVSHFIETAQPYFFPPRNEDDRQQDNNTTPTRAKYITKNTWIFLGLLGVLVLTVVSLAFFVTVGLTLLTNTVFPDFFGKVAGGLVKSINGFIQSNIPYIALGIIVISGFIFASQKGKIGNRWKQWSLLGLLLFLLLVVNGLNVILSYAFRFIDTALNERNADTFWQFMIVYGLVLVAAIPIIVIYRYTRLKLGLMWREWLTKHFLGKYFNNRAYYELDSNAINTEVDNPDQRITQDIKSFTTVTLDFLLDILDSILTLFSFSAILYTISKELTWGLLIYAIFGTAVALIVGSRLVSINYNQLRLEANFRYSMVRVRDNAESIAFYRGESLERGQVIDRLMSAIRNFDLLIIWQSIITLFQLGYNYFTRLIPYIIIAPLYLQGELDFGAIAQASVAFSQVLSALSLITNQIQGITEFAASINRLGEFYESLDPKEFKKEKEQTSFIYTHKSPDVALENVTLHPPNSERTLIENVSLNVSNHNNLLIMGASGTGKSSLLRAIAGLWNSGDGIIYRPDAEAILFLPQKPYMILGTLREQLLYPNTEKYMTDEKLKKILEMVNLPNLADRFDFEAQENWENVLSLGEQQRVAFARILITQPRYAILDEATSALDVKNEERLYQELSHMGTTYISVGHRPTLRQYHQQLLEIFDGGHWELTELSKN